MVRSLERKMDSEIEDDQTAESQSGAQVDFPSLYISTDDVFKYYSRSKTGRRPVDRVLGSRVYVLGNSCFSILWQAVTKMVYIVTEMHECSLRK